VKLKKSEESGLFCIPLTQLSVIWLPIGNPDSSIFKWQNTKYGSNHLSHSQTSNGLMPCIMENDKLQLMLCLSFVANFLLVFSCLFLVVVQFHTVSGFVSSVFYSFFFPSCDIFVRGRC